MTLATRPVGPQVAVEEQVQLRGDPALDVHPVGDVADRHVLLGPAREQGLPHPPRDHAVQRADAVGVLRELQRQHGHAERLVVVGRVDPPQAHEVLVREVQGLADLAEVLLHQRGREPVVAGGHRRVGGEDRHRRDVAHHLAERQAGRLDLPADHLQRREGAVPLVEVQHRGGDLQGVQGPDAADAQEQLLADAGPGIAAVEPRRQRRGRTRCSPARWRPAAGASSGRLPPARPARAARRVAVSTATRSGRPSSPATLSIGSCSTSALR